MLSFTGIRKKKIKWSVKTFIGFKRTLVKSDIFPFGMVKTKSQTKNFFISKSLSFKNPKNPSNKVNKRIRNSPHNNSKIRNKKRNLWIFMHMSGPNLFVIKI